MVLHMHMHRLTADYTATNVTCLRHFVFAEVMSDRHAVMSHEPAIDPRCCPLCGQANQCAMELERSTGVKQPPCWCTQARFDAALLARVPEQASGKACICAACAQGKTA